MKGIIEKFLKSMEADGKSTCTIKAYCIDLNGFFDFFEAVDLNTLKYPELREWVNSMEQSGLSATTRARKISCVKSFFKYLSKMDIIDKNYAEFLETPKQPKKQPKVISTTDAEELLEAAKSSSKSETVSYRDYTIISMILLTGIRREELTNITLKDIDMDSRCILIHGKGNKERVVYVNDTLYPTLKIYLTEYRDSFYGAEESKYLFVSSKGNKISLAQMNNIVNKVFEWAGLKEQGISVHSLRKRFATTMFENTGDIATVSKALGHSSPTVTMRYVAINDDKIRAAANSVSF